MLFTYRYLENHSIEQLQGWLDYLFLEVWCKAKGAYDISQLDGCPDLRAVVEEIYYDDQITTDHLDGPIKEIYSIFEGFDDVTRQRLKSYYLTNNDIERLCTEDGIEPLTYKKLAEINVKLSDKLKTFYKSLYTDIIGLKPVWSRIGKLEVHYLDFVKDNNENICPFCGIHSIKGEYHSKREAYDHWLPKDIYPFNSVNFRNLPPMCHECNSSYKLVKDPLTVPKHRDPLKSKAGTRRKAFYPFSAMKPEIQIEIALLTRDIVNLKPQDLAVEVTSTVHGQEVEAWKEVFGIDERYQAACCYKNDGQYWYHQIMDEIIQVEALTGTRITIVDWIYKVKRSMVDKPFAEINFLKRPFLEGCERAGVFK